MTESQVKSEKSAIPASYDRSGFTVRDIIGEDKYIEVMAKFKGIKAERMTPEEMAKYSKSRK